MTFLTASMLSLVVTLSAAPMPTPTFCAEWVKQSSEGYERLTLFSDRTLVWKTRRGEVEDVRRKTLDAEERKFYCDYFARVEFWELPDDMRSGLTGQFVSGTLLKRFDGAVFRITLLDEARGIVELQGVSEPFSYFRKIEELRFFFEPPPETTR